MQDKIRILIVDDHSLFREGLKQIFQMVPDFHVVGVESYHSQTLEIVKSLSPSIIITDVSMSDKEKWITLKLMCRISKVMILSHHDDKDHVREAFQFGVSSYLLKDMQPKELIKAIHIVAKGQSYVSPSIASKLIGEIRSLYSQNNGLKYNLMEKNKDKLYNELTKREKEILQLIVDVGSNRAIGKTLKISEKTVKNHIFSIFRKLGLEDRTQAVIESIKQGWVHF